MKTNEEPGTVLVAYSLGFFKTDLTKPEIFYELVYWKENYCSTNYFERVAM